MKKESKASQLEREMYTYTHRCELCGLSFGPTPGKPSPRAMYLCHRCRGEMVATVTQVRSEEEARWNARWTGFFKEACPECDTYVGHRVEDSDDVRQR